ncbi:insulinase family protein [Pedobacter sp. MC2016-15]|uniref:M16 family metallopeptidase n=1 Tax=Pedobacter sp. MC2016-15 TaxID=2994473 RepID=UPI0022462946|nr:M16 family metallopeptidase [Pedobacter sp. MC2016-15]MCX2481670.1 insulinase family protein [Pedobacter sp. MC2016-15]
MIKKTNFALLGIAVCLAVSTPVSAQKKPLKPKQSAPVTAGRTIPTDPEVKIGKLPNGLTYYIRKNTEPKKRAELYLANRIGSLMENDDQQGLAHFTEHMAFNGTRDFPKNDIINYLQKAGVRFGADLNAYTGFDQTVYQLPIPTDSAEVFRTGFKILSNWAGRISMAGEEIDRERGVIIEEDRQRGKNAQERMTKQLLPVLLKDSRYANRIPIGKTDLLKTFTHDKIKNFYADWYRPDLQAVIAVGDFDVAEVEKLIIANFSDLKNPLKEKERVKYSLPDNKEPLVKIITDPEQQYNIALAIYKHHGTVTKTTADLQKSLMYSMINAMISARFQEILQKGNAPFLFAQSAYGPFQGGIIPNLEAFQTVVAAKSGKDLESAITAAVAETERVVKFGFVQSELDVVKRNIEAGNEKKLKEKDKTASASFVQQYLNNFLTGSPMGSIDFSYAETKKSLTAITLSQVNILAKTLLTPENQILIVQAPEKEKANLPTQTALLAAFNNAGKNITAYVDDAVNKPLLTNKPVAGKITAEKKYADIDVTEWTLSNGIKVILKPTDFKNDQIAFSSFGRGGTSLANPDDYQSADFSGIIQQSGVGDFNPSQLNKLLAGNTGRAESYIDELYQGFSGSSSPKDIETAFQMVYAYANSPRKDSEIYNKYISDYKVTLENKNANPASVFADTVQAVLSSYNKRNMPNTLADVDKVSLDKAFAFYKERFADLGEQTFVFVGNFDLATIRPLVETYIASLPSLGKKQNFVDLGANPPKGLVSKTVYKGLEDKASVQLYIHGDYDYTAGNNVQLEALSTALENKILERLREKESGVYSPSVRLSVSKFPNSHYYYTISFSCATANVEKLIAAAMEEVRDIKTNGATADDISKFKSEEQRQTELNLRNNGYWLSYLTTRLKYGDDLNQLLGDKKRIDAVSVESTKAAAQRFLNGDNYIRLVLMPQK